MLFRSTAEHVGQAVTAVTSAITRRLLQLGEEKLGPPPVPYVWVACGSQARREQTSVGDQDNAMIISNEMERSVTQSSRFGRFKLQCRHQITIDLMLPLDQQSYFDIVFTGPKKWKHVPPATATRSWAR